MVKLGTLTRGPRVVRIAVALLVSTSATAVLGIVFWILAAHLFTTDDVGRGSAEISSMMLIAQLAQLNLANALLRFLPKAGTRTGTVVLLGYLACILLSLVVATAFLLTPLSGDVVTGGVRFAVLYVIAVPLWTIFVVQDGVLTALRQAVWVPVENVSFGLAKLLLLPVLVVTIPGQGVFLAWTLPVVLVVAAVNSYLFLRVIPGRISAARGRADSPLTLPPARQLASFVSAGYLTSIVSVATTFLLPVIVIKELGPTANAHFYVPWLVGIAFHNLMLNIASSFVVEASHEEDPFHALFWKSVKLMIGITALALVATVGVGPYALQLLSGEYARAGGSVLRWIGLSFPFTLLTTLFTAALWMRRKLWGILAYQFAQTAILIGLTYGLLGTFGIDAPGIANLAAVAIVGVLSIRALVRWYHWSVAERPRGEQLVVGTPPAS